MVVLEVPQRSVVAPIVGRVLRLLPKKRGGLGGTSWARRSGGLRADAVRLVRARVAGAGIASTPISGDAVR